MKTSRFFIGMALAGILAQGTLIAPRAVNAAAQDAERIEGVVTKIELERNRVTVRSSDGMSHEFEASAETLKDLKVGDRIEAKRRPETN
jgi:Cu/Ag efflux protein CusF